MDFAKLLSKDTSYVLAMFLDSKSLLNMCQSNKRFYEWIGKNENFWKEKMGKDYPFLFKYKPREKSYRSFYLEMFHYIEKIEEKYGIPYIPTEGYYPKYFSNKYFENKMAAFNEAMAFASGGGYMDIVKLMNEKGARDFNWAMQAAANRGHIKIVKYLIEKGATDFNTTMNTASLKGHIDIVKLMIEKGATDFDSTMCSAAYGGYMNIVKLMIESGATEYDSAIDFAKAGYNIDIVKYLERF